MNNCPNKLLDSVYKISKNQLPDIPEDHKKMIESLSRKSHQIKGLISVLLTSACYKTINPKQDIRFHQKKLKNGYSGRTFDTNITVPFCKEKGLPCPKQSGWQTRSLEQPYPYKANYKGSISKFKNEFLILIDYIEKKDSLSILSHLIFNLKKNRKKEINPSQIKRKNFSSIINDIINLKHKGTSKVPVLIVKLIEETVSKTKILNKSHYSSDLSSGSIGDLFNQKDKTYFEIKHNFLYDKFVEIDILKKIQKMNNNEFNYIFISTSDKQSIEFETITVNNNIVKMFKTSLKSYIATKLFNNSIDTELLTKKLCDELKDDPDISNELYKDIIYIITK